MKCNKSICEAAFLARPRERSEEDTAHVDWLWKSVSRSIPRSLMLELFRGRSFGPGSACVQYRSNCGKKKHSVYTIVPVISELEMDGQWTASTHKSIGGDDVGEQGGK